MRIFKSVSRPCHLMTFSQFITVCPSELLLPALTPTERAMLARVDSSSRTAVEVSGLPYAGHRGSGGKQLALKHFVSSVEMLKWAVEQKKRRGKPYRDGKKYKNFRWIKIAFHLAAERGNVEVLEYCLSQPYTSDHRASGFDYDGSSFGSYLMMCPCPADGDCSIIAAAVRGGQLQTLVSACEKWRIKWTARMRRSNSLLFRKLNAGKSEGAIGNQSSIGTTNITPGSL